MKLDLPWLFCSQSQEQEAANMAEAVKAKEKPVEAKNYKGFVAGVFSGIAKLSGQQKPTAPLAKNTLLLLAAHTDNVKCSRPPV